ncbi:acyl carrier protein [Streptomyces sp. NPDC001262]|uniref:acyl carrier protein n=1 Tax=unclassified Streptomyces TaxID=2593676 RepID=UPI00300F7F77
MSDNVTAILSPELRTRIRDIVADVLEVPAGDVAEEHSFTDDFDADSLMVIEMFSRFERQLDVEIPQEELVGLDTLGSAYALIERRIGAGAGV